MTLITPIDMSLVVYRLVHAPVTRESGVRLPDRELKFLQILNAKLKHLFLLNDPDPYCSQHVYPTNAECLSLRSDPLVYVPLTTASRGTDALYGRQRPGHLPIPHQTAPTNSSEESMAKGYAVFE